MTIRAIHLTEENSLQNGYSLLQYAYSFWAWQRDFQVCGVADRLGSWKGDLFLAEWEARFSW